MKNIDNIPIWGDPIDEGALRQIKVCAQAADHVALMADHHLGYSVPIGGVVAYKNEISPSGIGYDIGCGNLAVKLDIPANVARANIKLFMSLICNNISFGIGQVNGTKVDHDLFDDEAWKISGISHLKEMARNQLGTIGGGNHYIDLLVDEEGYTWIGVHFGSRGFGHKTATHFLKAGGAKDGIHEYPLILHVESNLGAEYLECMRLAGRYAYAGRDWVCETIADLLCANIIEKVHNHHNFAWKEIHGGEDYWVVRKGATPAFPGQRGFVGGSMGDISVILEGADSEESKTALYSTVHGAGRIMSRTRAKGRVDRKTSKMLAEGEISQEMMDKWIGNMGVELRGGDRDEAPQAYKRIEEVLGHHKNTIKIIHTLIPIGVAMAGANIVDPYKD